MKTTRFTAQYFQAPVAGQIGPQGRELTIEARSLTAARKAAKEEARERDWRLIDVFPETNHP